MNQHISSIIFGISILASSIFLGRAYTNGRKIEGKIEVKGLGKMNFNSDLIVWNGRFETENMNLKEAYKTLENNKLMIVQYLEKKDVNVNQISYSSVNSNRKYERIFSSRGNYEEKFTGYTLAQSIKIESKEVEKIEKISREITELLNQGVQFYSELPSYYYTKLADLKIKMISKATGNAKMRAEKISEFSSEGELGELVSAKMGVFQITGKNSNENYSWSGAFNTTSKEKTASITVKLVYKLK